MAQNVFDASLERNNQLNRNPFDWSHVWNGTTKHGTITPVFCELVPQKHSIRINPEFGLEMMPMVFPVQTRQFARLNFFKVTLRSLWEDYMDYVSNYRDDLEEPYLLPDEQAFKKAFLTGTLGDYLNIPTRGVISESSFTSSGGSIPTSSFINSVCSMSAKHSFIGIPSDRLIPMLEFKQRDTSSKPYDVVLPQSSDTCAYPSGSLHPGSSFLSLFTSVGDSSSNSIGSIDVIQFLLCQTTEVSASDLSADIYVFNSYFEPSFFRISVSDVFIRNGQVVVAGLISSSLKQFLGDDTPLSSLTFLIFLNNNSSLNFAISGVREFNSMEFLKKITIDSETSYQTTPFATQSHPDNLRLLAYKFRAYEAVYNAFYRDVRNDPFIIDGRPVYNKWLPTMKGGADSTPYELHQCNWERDMFTTCIPSPQQGRAPLAGLTVYDAITTNEDGSYSVRKATALVTEDGAKYGITYNVSEDGQTLETVDYEPLSDKTEVVPIRSTLDLVNSGLSIETLRMTNAYQKYLELNMRKSFTYKAIMEGRYDVNLRFDELLMPEFIGGVSREMSMNVSEQSIDQQSTPDNGLYKDALGSKSGIAGVYGKANGNIECFCDEESIVIGLLTVTPVPIYTQMLPKDYTYRSILDHWAPEFSAIGYQPVTYKEMCPLNVASQSDISRLEDTFGYQRPWYEHVAKYDTAHGLFRSNMNGFLMTRFFKGFPELGGSFLKVDPDVVNQVFSVTEFTDKIFGYVKFNCVVQSPIPRVAIPRID